MAKETSTVDKTATHSTDTHDDAGHGAGPDGIAIAPPSYNLEVIDQPPGDEPGEMDMPPGSLQRQAVSFGSGALPVPPADDGDGFPFSLQAQLTVGSINDSYEREADQIAQQVTQMPHQGLPKQTCTCGKPASADGMCEDCRRHQIAVMRKSAGSKGDPAPDLRTEIERQRGSGSPLPPSVQSRLESAVETDLDDVRVHHNDASDRLAQSLGAQAFTTQNDIFFRQEHYQPSTPEGLKLLTHETVHVRQQRENRGTGVPLGNHLLVNRPGDTFEREADAVAQHPLPPPVKNPTPHDENATASPQPAPATANLIQRAGETYIVRPSSGDRDALLSEIRGAVQQQAAGASDVLSQICYAVVTNRFYFYGPTGNQPLDSFAIGPDGVPLPPGYYRETRNRDLWQALSEDEQGMRFWAYPSWEQSIAARMQLRAWLAEGELERFQGVLGSRSIMAIFIVIAPAGSGGGGVADEGAESGPPVWATEQVRQAQAAIAAAQQARGEASEGEGEEEEGAEGPAGSGGRGETGTGTGAAGEAGTQAEGRSGGEAEGTGGSGGGTERGAGTTGTGRGGDTPPEPVDDLPDQVVLWTNSQGVPYVNVWAADAHTPLRLREGESAEDLVDRIRDAAEALRESRDPNRSESIADGATSTDFDQERQATEGSTEGVPASIEEAGVGEGGANAPAYPARIINYGPDITVRGATNRFAMEIDYRPAGYDTLSQVAARLQRINFYWEIIDVTNVKPERRGELQREAPGESGEQVNPGSGAATDIERDMNAIREDTIADLEDLASADYVPLSARVAWLEVIGISNIVRMGGSLISSLISIVTTPRNEQSIGWDQNGEFLVRCIATPEAGEDAQIIRASSVAVHLVRIMNINQRATEAVNEVPQHLRELREKLSKTPEGPDRDALLREISAIETAEQDDTLEATDRQLRDVREKLRVLGELEDAISQNVPTAQRTPAARLLYVQLELMQISRTEYRRHLEQQRDALQATHQRIEQRSEGFQVPTYRPRVVLASEETGQVFQMIMILGEATDSRDGHWHYKLADVTSADTQDTYDGRSQVAGNAGRNEALRKAFIDFRENNGYGRGTIAIRLPDIGFPVTLEAMMRSAPGTRGRVMQRLQDLATVAEIAGLIISGPVGIAVGVVGGVAGAIVAADSLMRRHSAGRLRWDFQTVMDITGVVGGVVAVGGALSTAARGLRRASWITRIERVENVLHVYAVTQLGSQVIIIPLSLQIELQHIEQQEGLSPGERAALRAEAMLRAVRSGVVTAVSAAQMYQQSQLEQPQRAQEAVAELEAGATPRTPETGETVPDTSGVTIPPVVEPDVVPGGEASTGSRRPSRPGRGAAEPPTRPTETDVSPGSREPGGPGEDGPGGSRPGRGPAPAVEPTLHAPERVVEAGGGNAQRLITTALGLEGTPYFGRIRIVDGGLVTTLWERVQGGPMPESAFGLHDPDANILYISRNRMTDSLQQQIHDSVAGRMSRHARRTFGEDLYQGYLEQSMLGVVYDSQAAPSELHAASRLLATRLDMLVGSDVLATAMFTGEVGPVRSALREQFGAARANTIEQAFRSGRIADALMLLDPPNLALLDNFGEMMSAGVADFMTREMGGRPRSAERAALISEIADRVGADLLRRAYLSGDVDALASALEQALGLPNRQALAEAMRSGDISAARRALRPAEAPPPARRGTPPEETGERPSPRRTEEPASPEPRPETPTPSEPPTPLGQRGQALRDAIQNNAGDVAQHARATIEEVGDFNQLRAMIEAGQFGEGTARGAASEALQAARNALIQEVLTGPDGIQAAIEARHPGVTLEFQDLGTPGFNSDRDITVRASGGREVSQDVAASVEAVRDAYAALRRRGLEPDQALDTNFYTELHEGRIQPTSPAEATAIVHDQSVVSLAEMRMTMSEAQWAQYRESQLQSLGEGRPASGSQALIEAEARSRARRQFDEAELLASQLRPEGRTAADVLSERQQLLLEALEQGASPREIRQRMAEIKLLEPDAYGSRAAVEGVVGEQQRMARGSSGDYMTPGRQLPEDRASRLAVLAQEASSSLAKMFGHVAGPTGNSAAHVQAMAKYLARIHHAFREAGLAISHPLIDAAGGVVGAKHEADSVSATVREVRAWAEDNNLSHLSDQVLLDRWVQEAQALGQQMVVRLRTDEQIAQAVEGPAPPPRSGTPPADDPGGGGPTQSSEPQSSYRGIEASEPITLGGEAHRVNVAEEDGQLVVRICTDCRRLRVQFERVIGDPALDGLPDLAQEMERLHHRAGRLERDLNRNRIAPAEAQRQCDEIAARLNDLAQAHPEALGPVVGIPRGFTSDAQLSQFGQRIHSELAGVINYFEAYIQGSAVSGRNWETGQPFGPHSDIDLAIVSRELFAASGEAERRGQHTEPNPRSLNDILQPLRQALSEMLEGREVNVMVYESRRAMEARGDYIEVSIDRGSE